MVSVAVLVGVDLDDRGVEVAVRLDDACAVARLRLRVVGIVEYGDGWIPPAGWLPELGAAVAKLRDRERELGRPPAEITVVGVKPTRAAIGELEELGVARAVIAIPPEPRDATVRRLDHYLGVLG